MKHLGYETGAACYKTFNCKTSKNSKVSTNIIFRKTSFAVKSNCHNQFFQLVVAEPNYLRGRRGSAAFFLLFLALLPTLQLC